MIFFNTQERAITDTNLYKLLRLKNLIVDKENLTQHNRMPKSAKRARGKRGGKKHQKKETPPYIIKRRRLTEEEAQDPNGNYGFHTDIDEDNPIHEIRKLKPEFVFIDAHDTILHDYGVELCSGSKDVRKLMAQDTYRRSKSPLAAPDKEVRAYGIGMSDIIPVIKLMLEFLLSLPDNVIVYGNPRHTPLFLAYLQLTGLRNDTLNRVSLFMFAHKGEDYHYIQDGQTGASLRRNITDRLVLGKPVETDEKIECGICMEEIARAVDNSQLSGDQRLPNSNHITNCNSCGAPACNKCMTKHLHTITDIKFSERRNGATCKTERKITIHKPENGTCPFCRGGWWDAEDRNQVPQSFLDFCKEWIDTGTHKPQSLIDIAKRNTKELEEELY